jgi:glycosyltransferase involved in cell wall biosynthesis
MRSPLVSIALCTYNGEKYLKEQLDSLLNQTYPNTEIIVVDDHSTDSTFEILKGYTTNPKIKLYRNEKNLGFVKNFEKAITYCKGEMIALSDQDDIWDLKKIEFLLDNIQDNILIYHNSLLITSEGSDTKSTMKDNLNFIKGSNNLGFIFCNCLTGHSILFKCELLKYLFPIPEKLFHDVWIGFVATTIDKITYTDKCLVKYRQHENNVTDILTAKGSSKNEIGKSKKEIREMRYQNMLNAIQQFKSFKYLKKQDIEKLEKLEKLYLERKTKSYSFSLLFFLIGNINVFFYSRKKSLLSKLFLIASKESVGLKIQKALKGL